MFAFIKKLLAKVTAPSLIGRAEGGPESSIDMEKFLIVGLGNIGPDYVGTRHNIGFNVKGRQLILLKPSTFMNLSGNAVRYWMQQEKIELEHLLICVDDLALPFGQLRMKPAGSDAGHNGLKHIAQVLGTQQYARLRFGIGNDFYPGQQVDYVLSTFPPEEEALIPERTKETSAAIKTFCLAGIQMAMNQLNKKRPTPNPSRNGGEKPAE